MDMRTPRGRGLLIVVLVVVPLLVSTVSESHGLVQSTFGTSFIFAASGDLNSPTKGAGYDSLRSLEALNPNFFLGLGDLSYNSSYIGTQWCKDFKSQFHNIEIIPGYHDTGDDANISDTSATRSYEKYVGSPGSSYGCPYSIAPFPSCESEGCDYGREYYFDYPTNAPIARVIMISPGIYNVTGRCNAWKQGQPGILNFPDCNSAQQRICNYLFDCWNYERSDLNDVDFTYNYTNSFVNHWNWTRTAIDGGHNHNEWVIVGVHKLCISAGRENCEIGPDLFNLLLSEKVDLILSGDDHAYERSKQLALNSTIVNNQPVCNTIPINQETWATYNPGCVVDDGSNGYYRPGFGTVLVTAGTFGSAQLYSVDDPLGYKGYNAAESGYFARLMGGNTPGASSGFVAYTVSGLRQGDGRIEVQTHFSGSFQDSFVISPPPVATVNWSPLNPGAGEVVTFSAQVAGGVPPYTYEWEFGDGAVATGQSTSHVYSTIGYYRVTLNTTDLAGNSRESSQLLGVGSWNSAVPCSPAISTLENLVGQVSIQRIPSNPNSTGADYSGGGFKLVGSMPVGSGPTNWPFSKRALYPFRLPLSSPCSTLSGVPAFVEIHGVTVATLTTADCGLYFDQSNGGGRFPNGQSFCSTTFNLDSSMPQCPACYLHRVYSVIDRDWKAAGIAPPSPVQGQVIDVQAFVYWNPQYIATSWHSFTGWELHVTGWRVSTDIPLSPASFLSSRAFWYTLSALGATFVLVTAYAARMPTRIRAVANRTRRDRYNTVEPQ